MLSRRKLRTQLIILILLLILLSVFLAGCAQKECKTDYDCVPATCCHASECTAKEKAPGCEGIFCSMECRPYTMDCGQGRCICKNNRCIVEIASK